MKICVFGDIHANFEQMKALSQTEDFMQADLRICLGDVVGMGPYNLETLECMLKFDVIYLCGNHEARITKEIDDLTLEKDGGVFVQYENCRKAIDKYLPLLRSLPKNYDMTIGGKKFRFTHYGWHNHQMSNKILSLKNQSLTKQFGVENEKFDYVIYGHIHTPSIVVEGSTTFFDVGSLGLKSLGNYLMIYEEEKGIVFKSKFLPFDKDKFIEKCKNLNYPGWEELYNFIYDNNYETFPKSLNKEEE